MTDAAPADDEPTLRWLADVATGRVAASDDLRVKAALEVVRLVYGDEPVAPETLLP